VIAVDANLLLYAGNRRAVEHDRARRWLDAHLSGPNRVGLPWPCLLAFVRIVTNPAVMGRPLSVSTAWAQVEEWLGSDVAWIPVPGDRHRAILGELMSASMMTSRLVSDAHLAALAIEHGLTLYSTDGDFARFPGLKWHDPLAG
jgi:uncharacterized protein